MKNNITIEDRVEALRQHLIIDIKKSKREVEKIIKKFKKHLENELEEQKNVKISTKARITLELPKIKEDFNLKTISFSRLGTITAVITTQNYPQNQTKKVSFSFVSSDDLYELSFLPDNEKLARGRFMALENFKTGKFTYEIKATGLHDISYVIEAIIRNKDKFPADYKNVSLNVGIDIPKDEQYSRFFVSDVDEDELV